MGKLGKAMLRSRKLKFMSLLSYFRFCLLLKIRKQMVTRAKNPHLSYVPAHSLWMFIAIGATL